MASRTTATDVSRRDALKAVGAVVAGATFGLSGSQRAESQTPKRGGVFRICAFTDPSGFDPHLTINWWTQINLSFTHSRLLKHKAGPGRPERFQWRATSPSRGRNRATRPTSSSCDEASAGTASPR